MNPAPRWSPWLLALACALLPRLALAQDGLDAANTSWILTSTALVLFMTLPGLSLFYAGLVRTRNVLSVLMQCFSIAVMISILWLLVGYSIAFGPSESAWWGGLGKAFFQGVGVDSLDVFPVHGVGGITGTGMPDGMSMGSQLLVQVTGVAAIGLYTGALTWLIVKGVDATMGLRVDADEEQMGLDITEHDEKGYSM